MNAVPKKFSFEHTVFANGRMEVSKRRILQKHLEPARPLRRCLNAAVGKQP